MRFLSILMLSLLLSSCGGNDGGGGGSSNVVAGTTSVTISLGSSVAAGLLGAQGSIPAGVQSMTVEALDNTGVVIVGLITANLPNLTVTLSVPNGTGIQFRILAYSAVGATGNILYEGVSVPQSLTGVSVSVPVTMNLSIAVTASLLSIPRGGLIDLSGTVAGTVPPATSPLLWNSTGGTLAGFGVNGGTAVWTAPTKLGVYTVSANVDPAINASQDPAVVGTVSINVVNQAPTVALSAPTVVMGEGSVNTAVIATATDLDGDVTTLSLVAGAPAWVALNSVTGVLTLSPPLGVLGTFTASLQARDALGALSVVSSLSITVNNVNQAPVPTAASMVTPEGVASKTTIFPNDPDIGDTHVFAVATAAVSGTASVDTYGVVSYTPNAFFNGTDSVTVKVTDAGGLFGSVTIPVTVTPVNNAPTSATATITTLEDTVSVGVTPTVVDPDVGDTHTFTITTQAVNGVASIVGNQLVYTPALNKNGVDSFTFTATDAGGLSVIGTANVTVTAVNDAPVFTGVPTIVQTAPLVGTVLSLAGTATSDVDLDVVTLFYQWQAAGLNIVGATAATYTLTAAESGKAVTCVITANDGSGAANATAIATSNAVTIGNSAPIAVNDAATTLEDTAVITVNVLLNDTDANGDILSVSIADA